MIVIPMAGLSSRFTAAGYSAPKYMLDAHGHSLFWHSVNSFRRYFSSEPFLFIYRDIQGTKQFIEQEIQTLGIANVQFLSLDSPTKGQAETVIKGLETANIASDEAITIFNIDTFRPGFEFPELKLLSSWDGYIEVFEGDGDHWSFALPIQEGSTKVARTAEKKRISRFCSTGLYYFRNQSFFRDAYQKELDTNQSSELYIAPIYNHLIARGDEIHFHLIKREAVTFCGVPSEYTAFLNQAIPTEIE